MMILNVVFVNLISKVVMIVFDKLVVGLMNVRLVIVLIIISFDSNSYDICCFSVFSIGNCMLLIIYVYNGFRL